MLNDVAETEFQVVNIVFLRFIESLPEDIQLRYRMDHRKRGLAIVFNHENFSLSVGMNRRTGTELDARNLRKYLGRLGFEVVVFQDLRVAEIKRQFERGRFLDLKGTGW